MRRNLLFLLLAIILPVLSYAQKNLSLAGEWEVAFDADDAGSHRQVSRSFSYKVHLPGTTDQQGLGDSLAITPSLTRESLYQLARRHKFIGTAWYRRSITIPQDWQGKQIELMLERVLWQSRVFVDGKEVDGQEESLTTPHRYDLTALMGPGSHTILVRIDNKKQYDISYQNLAHAYTDGTQTIWNGAIGKLSLTAYDPVSIRHISTDPDQASRSVRVSMEICNKSGRAVNGDFHLKAQLNGKHITAKNQTMRIDTGRVMVETMYDLSENFQKWDEFSPAVYLLDASLSAEGNVSNCHTTFGVRTWTGENSQLHVNGRRIFLRGTLESAIFPITGHPPTDKAGWLKVFSTAKLYGLNHIRFHSWCPPGAAFDVADSLGFYLQVELPMWSLQVGEDPKANRFIAGEADRIGREYGNHPSFCFWSMGNELEGNFDFLNNLVSKLKKSDTRHLYTTTTYSFQPPHGAWPEPTDDFFVTQQTKLGWVRGQGIFNQQAPSFVGDYTSSLTGIPVPVVTHEVGQYAMYPNVAEIKKYTGVLAPLNLIAIRNDLEQKGMLVLADSFLKSSGKLAAILYKEEMERILRTKGASGIQLLDLHDFPGQGTADIGLLDAFWDSKGILSDREFRQFCSPVVPLLRFEKATFTNLETFHATAELANFSAGPLANVTPEWTLTDDRGKQIAKGKLPVQTAGVGNGMELGKIEVKLSAVKSASRLTLTLALKNTSYANSWHIWVYPALVADEPGNIVITQSVDEALTALSQGKKVLFNPDYRQLRGVQGKFVPVFWSPVHFPSQAGTMGILCDPKHPALRNFPTEAFTDWQWWDLCTRSTAMILPDNNLSPIVRHIDNFANNRQLGGIFEANVGQGKLIVCSFDISNEVGNRPVARQLRHSLLQYMSSPSFKPSVDLPNTAISSLIK
jgi:hypothetical protein